ncbi:OmpA family protein [Actinobacillus arthritidis]|uniref:OmpA family protein n=1 Tax=Actinobacillus arthritidis TaxID=157339 RepID=UPI002442A519|nr:OmpA family protein [Actinobacillus arthritidis]
MKKLLTVATVAVALSACSVRTPEGTLEHWDNYGNTELTTKGLQENQALAVFYRPESVTGEAINVYVNGDYQASLLEKSYTPIAVCASKQLFSASRTSDTAFGNRTEGARYTLPVQEIGYIRVTSDAKGQAVLTKVTKDVAEQEMASLKLVKNTLSRVVTHKNCEPVIVAVDLSASALFPINKSNYVSVLPEGKKQIADFAKHIKTLDASNINRIVVSGYTDPEGRKAYNQKLSERRAETVSKALKEHGITARVEAVGYGAQDFLVPNCAVLHPKNKKERSVCNQPNRRVEIVVYGNK